MPFTSMLVIKIRLPLVRVALSRKPANTLGQGDIIIE